MALITAYAGCPDSSRGIRRPTTGLSTGLRDPGFMTVQSVATFPGLDGTGARERLNNQRVDSIALLFDQRRSRQTCMLGSQDDHGFRHRNVLNAFGGNIQPQQEHKPTLNRLSFRDPARLNEPETPIRTVRHSAS